MNPTPNVELKVGDDVFVISPLPAIETFAMQADLAPALTEAVLGLGAAMLDAAEAHARQRDREDGTGEPAPMSEEDPAAPPVLTNPVPAAGAVPGATPGEQVAEAAGAFDLGEMDVATLMRALAPIMTRIAAVMPRAKLRRLMLELLVGATMNGTVMVTNPSAKVNPIDRLLLGRTVDLWRLFLHAVRVNYPDFFAGAGGVVAQFKAIVRSVTSDTSAGPSPSTG